MKLYRSGKIGVYIELTENFLSDDRDTKQFTNECMSEVSGISCMPSIILTQENI